jgi:hypothetical protein
MRNVVISLFIRYNNSNIYKYNNFQTHVEVFTVERSSHLKLMSNDSAKNFIKFYNFRFYIQMYILY